MEMVTGDRPGLLCEVGKVMRDKLIVIQTAKVLTVGERAEDVFYITTDDGQPLGEAQCNELKEAIIDALGQSG
jgi:[protein-PII] uridylyltransferase